MNKTPHDNEIRVYCWALEMVNIEMSLKPRCLWKGILLLNQKST